MNKYQEIFDYLNNLSNSNLFVIADELLKDTLEEDALLRDIVKDLFPEGSFIINCIALQGPLIQVLANRLVLLSKQ